MLNLDTAIQSWRFHKSADEYIFANSVDKMHYEGFSFMYALWSFLSLYKMQHGGFSFMLSGFFIIIFLRGGSLGEDAYVDV